MRDTIHTRPYPYTTCVHVHAHTEYLKTFQNLAQGHLRSWISIERRRRNPVPEEEEEEVEEEEEDWLCVKWGGGGGRRKI